MIIILTHIIIIRFKSIFDLKIDKVIIIKKFKKIHGNLMKIHNRKIPKNPDPVPTKSQSRNPDPDPEFPKVRESRSRKSSRDRDLCYPSFDYYVYILQTLEIDTPVSIEHRCNSHRAILFYWKLLYKSMSVCAL